jgi:hypothetical protein
VQRPIQTDSRSAAGDQISVEDTGVVGISRVTSCGGSRRGGKPMPDRCRVAALIAGDGDECRVARRRIDFGRAPARSYFGEVSSPMPRLESR